MYNIDFQSTFIKNFDRILSNNNNPAINSDEYIQYKTTYLQNTRANLINYEKFSSELSKLQQLVDFTNVSQKRITFTFLDKSNIENLKTQIKSLVISQRNLLQQFMSYLDNLNTTFISSENYRETKRSPSIGSIRSVVSNKSRKFKLFRK